RIRTVSARVADLPGNALGQAINGSVFIDRDAAGFGWFVDPTPADDREFAPATGDAVGRMDLLTALRHELGHVAGPDDDHGNDLMGELLSAGTRKSVLDSIFANDFGDR